VDGTGKGCNGLSLPFIQGWIMIFSLNDQFFQGVPGGRRTDHKKLRGKTPEVRYIYGRVFDLAGKKSGIGCGGDRSSNHSCGLNFTS